MAARGAPQLTTGRRELAERLRARREEIEEEALTRIYSIANPAAVADPAYTEGLRATAEAAFDYAFEALERGEERTPPPPPALLAQARLAARVGVGLDAVLRRYFAGYALLNAHVIAEVDRDRPLDRVEMKRLLQDQATIFDRLIAAVTEAYERQAAERHTTDEKRRAERVERLLGGEMVDASELAYDLGGHHLGIVIQGADSIDALRTIATGVDRRLLAVVRDEGLVWAWLGGRRPLEATELEPHLRSARLVGAAIAVGEPDDGLAGWRLTHRQAAAAFAIARRRRGLVRYADVSLLASALQDDLLAASLRRLYLVPLEEERGGEVLVDTLRAYFAAECNVSSAAMALGASRNTVASRLRLIEERLCCSIDSAIAELEVALRLDGHERDAAAKQRSSH